MKRKKVLLVTVIVIVVIATIYFVLDKDVGNLFSIHN